MCVCLGVCVSRRLSGCVGVWVSVCEYMFTWGLCALNVCVCVGMCTCVIVECGCEGVCLSMGACGFVISFNVHGCETVWTV